jgi:hypothetical protein
MSNVLIFLYSAFVFTASGTLKLFILMNPTAINQILLIFGAIFLSTLLFLHLAKWDPEPLFWVGLTAIMFALGVFL